MGSNKSEFQKVSETDNKNVSVLSAYNKIPYALINAEIEGSATDILKEFGEIMKYYKAYKKGIEFEAEGTGGHYVAAQLRYKKAATLINKEARFLFGQRPDINIESDGDVGKITEDAKAMLTTYQNLVDKILRENKFESILLKAAKDCFVGKRVAVLVNFNEENGVTIQFLPSVNFVYETRLDNPEVLEKFVCFVVVKERSDLSSKRIFRKKFQMEYEDGKPVCYLEETLHDGSGNLVEEITPYQPTLLDRIPASVIINDGLTGETEGESEIDTLSDYEKWYSKLSNADIDAERKEMNPVKYTVDMATNSTRNLSTGPGAYWDLQSDQNLEHPAPAVGAIKTDTAYSQALDTTLKRIKASMHEEVDIPDITLENIQGVVTSGKAMRCLYWPLIVRCNEKMKTWGPALEYITNVIIQGAIAYPNCIVKYTEDALSPVDYEVNVVQNYPLPEDEEEEKNMDLAEVAANTMSRKSYMKKWRQLTDHEVDEELQQIALELAMIEGTNMETTTVSEGTDDEGNLLDPEGNRDTDPIDGTPEDDDEDIILE